MINKILLMEFFKDDDIKVVDKDFYIKSQMKRDVIKYITILEQENEHLRTQVNTYENPDDYTLFYMWLDAKAKDKMKQLQEENKGLKEENILLKASEPMSKLAEDYGYKSRCEKAIEYINKNKHLNWYVESIFTDELLNILNGGDEE